MQQARGGALPAAPPRVRVAKLLQKRSRADLPSAPCAAGRESAKPGCFSAPNPRIDDYQRGLLAFLLHPVQAAPEVRAWLI